MIGIIVARVDYKVKDRKETEIHVVDHLSRLEDEAMREQGEVNDAFPNYIYWPLLRI